MSEISQQPEPGRSGMSGEEQSKRRTEALAGLQCGLRETTVTFQDRNSRNAHVHWLSVEFQRHSLKNTRPRFRPKSACPQWLPNTQQKSTPQRKSTLCQVSKNKYGISNRMAIPQICQKDRHSVIYNDYVPLLLS